MIGAGFDLMGSELDEVGAGFDMMGDEFDEEVDLLFTIIYFHFLHYFFPKNI